ncbi:MAG: serine protease [Cyanobacteria bacterium P01_G01_bin.19]
MWRSIEINIRQRQLKQKTASNSSLSLLKRKGWGLKTLLLALLVGSSLGQNKPVQTQTVPSYVLPDDTYSQDIYDLAQSTAVRIIQANGAGTGVIIYHQSGIYTVLTNWHVVGNDSPLQIMTADGQVYDMMQPPQQLGNFDLALLQFQSLDTHQVATVATENPEVGEKVYAAGFPLYEHDDSSVNTISQGTEAFRLTQGEVSVIPPKALPDGYLLGYTNDTKIGMSGGPIFNTKGFLVGVHGRGKYRDPDFGVYIFEDGSEPTPEMLETMIESSWGIPITTYLQFTSQASQD